MHVCIDFDRAILHACVYSRTCFQINDILKDSFTPQVNTPSTSPSWTLDHPGTVSGQGAAYASGPRLRDRRDDEQRVSPYDTKCNVVEIGVVNMGEIGAVRKRSR